MVVFALATTIAFAQSTGTVVDANTNEPLPGATVLIKGSKTGLVTGFDGTFSIEASSSDVLVVSYLGYNTLEVQAGDDLIIKLESAYTSLNEVAVIANIAIDRKTPVAYTL